MATGWKEIGGDWYYLEDSGAMATNKWIGNYYVQVDGTMATDKWIGSYYVDASGLWIKTETEHDWQNYTLSQTKYGYACNWCYKDITDYDDYYDCHMSFHTHIFYLFPSYYVAQTVESYSIVTTGLIKDLLFGQIQMKLPIKVTGSAGVVVIKARMA